LNYFHALSDLHKVFDSMYVVLWFNIQFLNPQLKF
jgi:hypothetical protein